MFSGQNTISDVVQILKVWDFSEAKKRKGDGAMLQSASLHGSCIAKILILKSLATGAFY